ncbi:hypothetical protein JCM10212_004734, partial [Sporobolomyces blumeae]
GLLEPQGSLSYHHAVFPVPPLPADLEPPLDGRALNFRKAKQTYDPARRNARIAAAAAAAAAERTTNGSDHDDDRDRRGDGVDAHGAAVTTPDNGAGPRGADRDSGGTTAAPQLVLDGRMPDMLQRPWLEPKTPEFADLTAFDDPHRVVDRLAKRAAQHWDKRDSVKEGETLTNFMFSVRMRGQTLRATPPGSF